MSEQTSEQKSYKSTLNLPRTRFAMKANLVQNEPASIKRWAAAGLYQKIREVCNGRPTYIFHDGPPYANGSIHLGHLLNKVLKDFIVRSKTLAGYDVPYVPGWDCHGLPIEHQVMQQLGNKAINMSATAIRRKCKSDAEKFVKLQSKQMQRLLTLADYDDPYLTMHPSYEAAVLDVFADLVDKGLVYRHLKPVHWSIENQTALAEAELEYYDREDSSIYVLFQLLNPQSLTNGLVAAQPVSLMIWTTTPWTLPANLAVAVNERYQYGLYPIEHRLVVIATELAPKVLIAGGIEPIEPIATFEGKELLGLEYVHPFVDRNSCVVCADYVTLEDGTGLVHIAPGHGVEDYQTGMREELNIYCPVRDDGMFDNTVPDWLKGVDVWSANQRIIDHLRESSHLFYVHKFTHSYPHDWRGKKPVIFRATEQWFLSVDSPVGDAEFSLRDRALDVTKDIRFSPDWGVNRMRGMLESRPDWCLSRQRAWGLPIPAFFNPDGKCLLTATSIRCIAQQIRQHGSDHWFTAEPEELLAQYNPQDDPKAPDWIKSETPDPKFEIRKSADIFDVWFESGSSWNAVVRHRFGDAAFPADLYLEGSDQHRGWFQLSLLPALGVTGESPFRNVLTHGFIVDKDGYKMSKSLGNTLEVEDLLKNYGADVCRWWVSSLNTERDIKVDESFFKVASEEYRKVRNTLRFLLSNLNDFDPQSNRKSVAEPVNIDAWVLGERARLVQTVAQAYSDFNFRKAHETIFNFCNDTMSAIYLSAVKDRLYCDDPDSLRRRRTQTTMHEIADTLIRLIAPILPHTADEAWMALHGSEVQSVHFELLPECDSPEIDEAWQTVMSDRNVWLKSIEEARQQLGIDNPLDCGLIVHRSKMLALFDPVDLADLCGISRIELAEGVGDVKVVDLRSEPRCDRSWKRDGTVRQRCDGGMLSDRDAAVLMLD